VAFMWKALCCMKYIECMSVGTQGVRSIITGYFDVLILLRVYSGHIKRCAVGSALHVTPAPLIDFTMHDATPSTNFASKPRIVAAMSTRHGHKSPGRLHNAERVNGT
jgi:hypothetical protein